MDTPNLLPLTGVTVLDFTRAVAGPYATMTLGDLGARVIKIEEPGTGDETRGWGPPFVGAEAAYFLGINRNKESVALNLKDPMGRDAVRRIACRADIVIENFRAGVADRLGIGYRELSSENPNLIYASISGFGQSGPDREKPGYDLIVQGMSGLMLASGHPGGPPVKVGFPIADILAGLFTAQAVLAALHARSNGGGGRYVEISLLESLLAAMCSIAPLYLLTGREPQPVGAAQANIVPYQVFRCRDGLIVAGSPNERLWRRFAEALDRPEWIDDQRYRNNESRTRHRAELVGEIERILAREPSTHWLGRFERHGVPCGPVLSIGQLLAQPQVAARASVAEMDHPDLGVLKTVSSPMRFDGAKAAYKPPPRLGEHTNRVLGEIGITPPAPRAEPPHPPESARED